MIPKYSLLWLCRIDYFFSCSNSKCSNIHKAKIKKLFPLKIYHPLHSVLIPTRAIICSPEHILEWHLDDSSLHESREEPISLFSTIRMERNMNIVSWIDRESHRWWGICPHETMPSEDRETDMEYEIFF